MKAFSFKRFGALLRKEWLQIIRNPITLRFIIALRMMQLFLFGYAVNTDPKNFPAGVLSVNHSKYERSLLAALKNTGYYDIALLSSEADAERALARGELLFVISIPPDFDRSVDRGEAPAVLIDADASDPVAVANATAALPALSVALDRDLPPVRQAQAPARAFQIIVHAPSFLRARRLSTTKAIDMNRTAEHSKAIPYAQFPPAQFLLAAVRGGPWREIGPACSREHARTCDEILRFFGPDQDNPPRFRHLLALGKKTVFMAKRLISLCP